MVFHILWMFWQTEPGGHFCESLGNSPKDVGDSLIIILQPGITI